MVGYAAESGSELSHRDAIDADGRDRRPARRQSCPSTSIQKGRDRQRVGACAAPRLQPGYIDKLEAEGVIQRQGDGFPLDQSRCLPAISAARAAAIAAE
jgi:hypothetical protein